jgi:ribonuclease Z
VTFTEFRILQLSPVHSPVTLGDMEIHCLGTTGYHPCDDRHTSCYLMAEDGIVLDAGTGIYRMAPLIKTDSIDILISHAHLDHTAGLTFLLDVFFQRPVDTVRVWGEAIKLEAIRTHLFNEHLFPVPLRVNWHPIDHHPSFTIGAGSLSDGSNASSSHPVTVDWRRQDHPGGSVGFRLRWKEPSKTLVYATDTTGDQSDEMRLWIDNADLLMHECYFRDNEHQWALKTGHCWTSRAAEIAKSGNVKKLLLTHINPLATGDDPVEIAKARAIFPESYIARDHAVIDF